jgi:5-formyltetrahydrofolate cyclo-ligase
VQHEGKAALRRSLGAARRARPPAEIAAARAAVAAAVLAHSRAWTCAAAYVPLPSEPGSPELLDALTSAGVRVLVPILRSDRDLDWIAWPGGSPLGLDGLVAADAVLVPALAVSVAGIRLGRGGGSYDRALPRRRPGVPVIALLYDGELVPELPHEPWDVPVTAVVTPDGWTALGPR